MFREALKIQDTYVASYFHLGLMNHKTHKFNDAIHCFTTVLNRLGPERLVFLSRGQVYQDMGNH